MSNDHVSNDLLAQVLTTHDLVHVDQPLFSAVELFDKTLGTFEHMPRFVRPQLDAALKSSDLSVKRVAWLMLLVLMPEIQQYVLTVGHCVKTPEFLKWCTAETEKLVNGEYQQQYGDECMNQFVVNACNAYEMI